MLTIAPANLLRLLFFALCSGRSRLFAAVNIDGDGVLLRRSGRAAPLGDVFFDEASEASDDVELFSLNIFLLADVGGEVEELERWQSRRVVLARSRGAPARRAGTKAEFPAALADRERAGDRMVNRRFPQRLVG